MFSKLVEDEMAQMLITLADNVCGLTKNKFRKWVKLVVDKVTDGKSTFLASEDWCDAYLLRHPEVTNRKGRRVLPDRIDAWTEEIWAYFFGEIAALVEKFGIKEVMNMDETGLESAMEALMVSSFSASFYMYIMYAYILAGVW